MNCLAGTDSSQRKYSNLKKMDKIKLGSKSEVQTGLISVVMPCFNAERYLREAVESVLNQTYPYAELIAVDDGSTDKTKTILQSFGNRVRLIEQKNLGAGPARNAGIKHSKGEFIAFLDADDYWSPDFLKKLHSALVNSNAALAYCGWQNIGLEGSAGKPYIPPDYEMHDKHRVFLSSASPWPIHAALTRRHIMEEVGGFDEQWPSCEDYDLWLRIAYNRPVVIVKEVLAFYRHHKQLQTSPKLAWDAKHIWLIKKAFIRRFPEIVKEIPASELRQYIDGFLLERGYNFYWRRNLVSAQKIFRLVLTNFNWRIKELKYLIPALLPTRLYIRLIQRADSKAAGE